jgi:hypothetical protein
MYNKAELKAMQIIASKLDWQKPAYETVETITKMVRNQQALELDTVGECDDFEETLLSIALWNKDVILSTMYVNDYESMVMWNVECFCEDMGITASDYANMVTYYNCIQPEIIADEYEAYLEDYYSDYDAEIMRDVMWMNNHC